MLKNHEKELMISINLFLDNILKINNLFKTLLQKYFDQKFDDVQKVTDQISNLESECDALRRDVERRIYSETLIPEIRGDVLGMLENLDKIPGQIQGNAHSFNTEKPKVNAELDKNFLKLCDYASECISLLIEGSRSFFTDKKITIAKCLEVSKVESKADKISTELKKTIFTNNIIIDAVLTDYGRQKLAGTGNLGITQYAFANQPVDWQLGFQKAASESMREIVAFHDYLLLPIIIAISVFVLFLMLYACIRFRASANPNPSKRTHNVAVEVLWTLIPCLILIVIAVPSFKILYKQDAIPKADLTIKAIGYQWYWGYEYPDENIIFESYMVEDKDLRPDQPRLLAVDNEVVVPVNKVVKVLITANDVLHAWALPSFGVKRDAVPGRINETWFKAEKVGTYYGQCSELCGIKHAFMPITVKVVTDEEYEDWLSEAKEKFAKEEIENNNLKLVSK